MYCINCGVKLADSERRCPLCGVKVYHPDLTIPHGEPLYPSKRQPAPEVRTLVLQVITTLGFLLPFILVLLRDLQANKSVTWSGYVMGALLLGYELFILPLWFKRPHPFIFVPCGFVSVALYLLYIDLATGGNWFLSFAFPVTGSIGLIITAVVVLLSSLRRGRLYILGGASIALGLTMLLMEFLLDYTFSISHFIGWSIYPLTVLVLLGGLLIFLAINQSARETVERKFFF